MTWKPLVIDVAHPPRSGEIVERELLDCWQRARQQSQRVLKIIHGHGSSGRGGSTKTVVRNWLFAHRSRFRSIVDGEKYDLLNPEVRELHDELGDFNDPDLGNQNPGITIVWLF